MRFHCLVVLALILPFVLAAAGCAAAHAQTDVAASVYGAFNDTTRDNNTQQSPANQAGGLIELRHISNSILGFEATYSFNRANQTYSTPPAICNTPGGGGIPGCSSSTEPVNTNAHEITADWIPSLHIANLRPFAVLGVGLLLDVPASGKATVTTISTCPVLPVCPVGTTPTTTTSTSPTQTSTEPVYVYGGGLDWGLLPHIGLRVQYRGNLYSAPNVTKLFSSTNAFAHTAEPMVGIYFRL
jgi:opacity protein-like surface antigen